MFKKLLSVLLAVMMVVSVMAVGVVNTGAATTEGFTPDPSKLYFDVEGTGWDMGARDKVAFHIFGGDFGTEENPSTGLAWGAKKAQGTATAGETGVFEIDPVAKLGLSFTPGVQYKIIFTHVVSNNWAEQTYDLLFTTDCFGHVAYCDGTEYENPVDSSKKTLAAFWKDMDATEVGPVLQISSIGNVVGTCPEEGKTPESIFVDFLTVVDSVTSTTTYANAKRFVVDAGTKTDQKLIDDIGAGLGLTKDQVQAAFTDNEVETTWDYTASTLPEAHKHTPGTPVRENEVPATFSAEGSYDEVVYCTECGEEISRETKTIDKVTPDPSKLYFDVDGTGWDMGARDKVAFHIFGGDFGTEENPSTGLAWGAKKAQGTATAGESGVFEIDPVAKLGLSFTPGVQYKIIFTHVVSNNWAEQTYDLLFTTDCFGHIAYCDGTEYENPVDSSKKTLAAFWRDMDATKVGPVLQISSIGNVVGTCPEEGKTPASIFVDFLTVVDSVTNTTTYANAKKYVVDAGTKTDQKLIDDIGTGLGLTKQQVYDAFTENDVETTWDYTVSTLPGNVVPAHTHTPGEPVQENITPATCTAAGSYDEVVYCSGCGEELSRTAKTIDKLAHTPGKAVKENEKPATCTAAGSYDEVVYCTKCDEELSRTTKTIDKLAHTPGKAVKENEKPATCTAAGSYDEVVYCSECGEELSRTTKTIDKLAHTPGKAVKENEKPATCTAAGSYDEVVYCTKCDEELSRTTKTIDKLAHNLTHYPEIPATEQAAGTKEHYTCSVCKKIFSDAAGKVEVSAASLIIPKLDHVHTPAEAVRENEIPATCKAAGSYDEVVYCTTCGAELSRTAKTIDKLDHTPGKAVKENVKPATCTAAGSYDRVVYCIECGEEISRTTKTISKLAHKPRTAVRENEVPATCTAAGSYDEVVYCTECGEEISRTTKTIGKLAHTIAYKPAKEATEEADGYKAHYECSVCGKFFSDADGKNEITWDQIVIPKIVTGKLGDVDGDGFITILDVTQIQRVLAGVKQSTPAIEKLGDVDGDGDFNIFDATVLQRWLLGMYQEKNIGELV